MAVCPVIYLRLQACIDATVSNKALQRLAKTTIITFITWVTNVPNARLQPTNVR